MQTSGTSCREIANAYSVVIPGRAQREPGIHQAAGQLRNGFRACAKWRIPE